MRQRGLEFESGSEDTGLAFVPAGIDFFIHIDKENPRGYRLVVVSGRNQEMLDSGTLSEDTPPFCDRPLQLSGTYFQSCEVECGC